MWALANRTAYAAERNWTRDKDGVHWWVVAVRATFDVASSGRLTLADEQLPPVLAPEYTGEPGASSLKYDSDLLAVKPRTDVLVVASAHAPRGRPAATVRVALRVGPIEKELLVHGERGYYEGVAGLTTTAPRPFVMRPIQYEFAFGGMDLSDPDPQKHRIDERNPIGRGFARRSAALHGKLAHTIEYPSGDPADRGPAGFGPIDPSWLPRRRFAGTYDARWEQSKQPLLPDDYDPAFGLCAPADQCPERPLAGGERVELVNMSPEGVLRFEVPRVALAFTTHIGRRRVEHGAQLATLLIEPDEKRVSVVWQSALRVAAPDLDYVDKTDIVAPGTAA